MDKEDDSNPLSRRSDDSLSRFLVDLRSQVDATRAKAARDLRIFVEAESREMSVSAFSKFMTQTHKRIHDLLSSRAWQEVVGGIMAIDHLIDVPSEDNESTIIRFASYLRNVFCDHTERPESQCLHWRHVLVQGAQALGHLARVGGGGTAVGPVNFVDSDVKQSLEWLRAERSKGEKRYAAVLILKELASNSSVLFTPHIPAFLEDIWIALHDSRIHVRQGGADALRAVLVMISQRNYRPQSDTFSASGPDLLKHSWCLQTFTKAIQGPSRGTTAANRGASEKTWFSSGHEASIHGSLLVVGELLKNTRKFMNSRYDETCKLVYSYRYHKSRLIQHTVIQLLPHLAEIDPKRFSQLQLHDYITDLLMVLKTGEGEQTGKMACSKKKQSDQNTQIYECDIAFAALGDIALSVGKAINVWVPEIIGLVRAALGKGQVARAALCCVSKLAQAVGPSLARQIESLVEHMFRGGLSTSLVDALRRLVTVIPSLLALVQSRLLACISSALQTRSSSSCIPKEKHEESLSLALNTLRVFWKVINDSRVSKVVTDSVVPYLKYPSPVIRKEAALTITKLLLPPEEAVLEGARKRSTRFAGFQAICKTHEIHAVANVVEKVVQCAISDEDAHIRIQVLKSLDARYDSFLCNPSLVEMLAQSLCDESLEVRRLSIRLMGRMTHHNPAFILPKLRTKLGHIMTELDVSADMRHKKEASELLVDMVKSCRELLRLQVSSLTRTLIAKLKEEEVLRSRKLVSNLLVCFGHLAEIDGSVMAWYVEDVIRLLFNNIRQEKIGTRGAADKQGTAHRATAYSTLSMVVENTGYVIKCYETFPTLLQFMMNVLRTDVHPTEWLVREQIIRCIGTMGALAPKRYYEELKLISKTKKKSLYTLPCITDGVELDELGNEQWKSRVNWEDAAAGEAAIADQVLKALLKMLSDSSLSSHHGNVIQTIMNVIKTRTHGEDDEVPFLAEIVDSFLQVLRDLFRTPRPSSEEDVRVLLGHLGEMCSIGMHALDPQAIEDVFELMSYILKLTDIGFETVRRCLGVLEQVALLAGSLDDLVPQMLQLLHEKSGVGVRKQENGKGNYACPTSRSSLDMEKNCKRAHRLPTRPLAFDVLRAFSCFGAALEESMYLIVPSVIELIESVDASVALRVAAIKTFGDLAMSFTFPQYLNSIVHPLVRILDSTHPIHPSASSFVPPPGNNDSRNLTQDLKLAALETLDQFYMSFGTSFSLYVPRIQGTCVKHDFQPFYLSNMGESASLKNAQEREESATTASSGFAQTGTANSGPHAVRSSFFSSFGEIRSVKRAKTLPNENSSSYMVGYTHGKYDEHHYNAHDNDVVFVDCTQDMTRSGGPKPSEQHNHPSSSSTKRLEPDQQKLKLAWEASPPHGSTNVDWIQWMHRFSLELLRESASPSLRACVCLAQVYQPLAKELFNSAFLSCWLLLHDQHQDALVRSLEHSLHCPNLPPDILQMLLNLAPFMDYNDYLLPINSSTIGGLAEKSRAYGKALYYKEMEFAAGKKTSECVEQLLSINMHLQQNEAADGMLRYAQKHLNIELEESWLEKLHRWDNALEAYQIRQLEEPRNLELTTARMRCMAALGDWDSLASLTDKVWPEVSQGKDDARRREMAPLAAQAAFNLRNWDKMRQFTEGFTTKPHNTSYDGFFYSAILAVHDENYVVAHRLINKSRETLDPELTSLVSESYTRAYRSLIRVQQLTELEQIIRYKTTVCEEIRERYRTMWTERLYGCCVDVDVWHETLQLRSLVIPPEQDLPIILRFNSLCRDNGRTLTFQCIRRLREAMGRTAESMQPNRNPRVVVAYLKNRFASGFRKEAWQEMREVLHHEFLSPHRALEEQPEYRFLIARCYLKLGMWHRILHEEETQTPYFMHTPTFHQVLHSFRNALDCGPYYKAWNQWAWANYDVVKYLESNTASGDNKEGSNTALGEASASSSTATGTASGSSGENAQPTSATTSGTTTSRTTTNAAEFSDIRTYVVEAVKGFVQSVVLRPGKIGKKNTFQNILRLAILWFRHGSDPMVKPHIEEGFQCCPLDTWLQVIPQILARLRSPRISLRASIVKLLNRCAQAYPQAVVFPLTVAAKSPALHVSESCKGMLAEMERSNSKLVRESMLVSEELIRISILWHEKWAEGLDEVLTLWCNSKDPELMMQVLEPLHEMTSKQPKTIFEAAFYQAYKRDLEKAWKYFRTYREKGDRQDADSACHCYYSVYQKMLKQAQHLQHLDMQNTSPELYHARDLELVMPGTYSPDLGSNLITIQSFSNCVAVLPTKRHPRIVQIRGSEGKTYRFLLKGNEDLKQDERVMQLFGLINNLLEERPDCVEKNLLIRRCVIVPLSHNSGLIEWIPRCDTIHTLIKQYRDSRTIQLSIEHTLMKSLSMSKYETSKWEDLTVPQKVDVFTYALENTSGTDLQRVLWLQSRNSECWSKRRLKYARSLAVMSMVGYILGLGDRHPSNLMIDRETGKVVHIDFGDCFEVAMVREKYPETVPFRLTRMLCNTLGVSGVEGNYRHAAEKVMTVMRDNKDAVMAMLEAFVYDPLITWRLLPTTNLYRREEKEDEDFITWPGSQGVSSIRDQQMWIDSMGDPNGVEGGDIHKFESPSVMHCQRSRRHLGPEGVLADPEHLSETAKRVVHRVYTKLIGTDFHRSPSLDVESQVSRLIVDATSHENLCQCYVGWCPFW